MLSVLVDVSLESLARHSHRAAGEGELALRYLLYARLGVTGELAIFSHPCAAVVLCRAPHLEFVYLPLEKLVFHGSEVDGLTHRAHVPSESVGAHFTEVLATTRNEVWISGQGQTDWTEILVVDFFTKISHRVVAVEGGHISASRVVGRSQAGRTRIDQLTAQQ